MTEISNIAEASHPLASEAEVDPKLLKGWLGDLPVLNPEITIAAVRQSCKRLNGHDLPAKRRFKLLGLYREQALALADRFETNTFQRAIEPGRLAEVAHDLGALLIEVEVGYNRLVRGATSQDGRATWSPSDPWAFAAFAALELAGVSMLHSYRANMPLVPGLFREMNFLFRMADSHSATRHPIPRKLANPNENIVALTNVAHLYKSLLLFHLSDPFSYKSAEITAGFEACVRYADAARIATARPDSNGPLAIADLAGANPPVIAQTSGHAGSSDRDASTDRLGVTETDAELNGTVRFVDLSPVVTALHREIQNRGPGNGAAIARIRAEELLARLRKLALEESETRGKEIPIRAAIGLDSIHHFLKDNGRNLTEALKGAGDTMQVRLMPKRGRAAAHKLDTWLLSEHQQKGYLLRQPGIGRVEAAAGELVGLTNGKLAQKPKLDIGLITWARHDPQDRLHIGVRPLSNGATPVTCSGDLSREQQPEAVPCLYVPRDKNKTGAALLLAPPHTAWDGTQITLNSGNSAKRVNVGTRRSDIASLACYELPERPAGR